MTTVHVELGPRSYDIIIRADSLAQTGEAILAATTARKFAVITDSNVKPLHAHVVEASLRKAGAEVAVFDFPAGEASKNITTVSSLWDRSLDFGLDRNSCIVAVGGGVAGDIAGFVAATLLRGVEFIQVPTTLLADVDSSVGGKTGIDHPLGKNLIGAFYQPTLVWIDPNALATLNDRAFRAGMAEVIKYGVIRDAALFRFIEDNRKAIADLDPDALEHVIAVSCRIKAEVVATDELEAGLRRILNYGHTIGHAIEALNYERLLHGEAVSLGMVAAANIACKLGLLGPDAALRQNQLLEACRMPVNAAGLGEIDCDEVIAAMQHDKKAVRGRPRFVLADRIGHVDVFDDVEEDIVREAIRELHA